MSEKKKRLYEFVSALCMKGIIGNKFSEKVISKGILTKNAWKKKKFHLALTYYYQENHFQSYFNKDSFSHILKPDLDDSDVETHSLGLNISSLYS